MSRPQDTTRTTPPLYAIRDDGTKIIDGRTFSDWTLMQTVGTGSTLTEDTDGYALLTVPAGETASIRADINVAVPNTSILSFSVWCSDNSDSNTTVGIDLDTTNDDLFTSFKKRYHTAADRLLGNAWTVEASQALDWAATGAAGWGTMRKIRLTVDNSASAVAVSAKLGDVYKERYCRSKVVLCFDDGTDDHHNDDATGAAGYLETLGLRGTFFVYSDTIDVDANFLTTAQCQAMHAAGHDIGNHTTDGVQLSTKSVTDQIASIADNAAWIKSNVGSRAENLLAYPGGTENTEIRASAAAAGVTHARTVAGYRYFHGMNGIYNANQIYGLQQSPGTAISTWMTRIDQLLERGGGTQIIIIHKTDHATGSGVDITWAEYTALIDALNIRRLSGDIDIITMSEWVKTMSASPRIETAG